MTAPAQTTQKVIGTITAFKLYMTPSGAPCAIFRISSLTHASCKRIIAMGRLAEAVGNVQRTVGETIEADGTPDANGDLFPDALMISGIRIQRS